jgi:hypothetical protein
VYSHYKDVQEEEKTTKNWDEESGPYIGYNPPPANPINWGTLLPQRQPSKGHAPPPPPMPKVNLSGPMSIQSFGN